MKYNARSKRISPELDDLIESIRKDYSMKTGLPVRNFRYTDVSAEIAKVAKDLIKEKKGKRRGFIFDTRI